jgi:hypothetical protein
MLKEEKEKWKKERKELKMRKSGWNMLCDLLKASDVKVKDEEDQAMIFNLILISICATENRAI